MDNPSLTVPVACLTIDRTDLRHVIVGECLWVGMASELHSLSDRVAVVFSSKSELSHSQSALLEIEELIISFDKGFPSNIMYLDVLWVPCTVSQCHKSATK